MKDYPSDKIVYFVDDKKNENDKAGIPAEDIIYYMDKQEEASEWLQRFILSLPDISVEETDTLLEMANIIQVDTIDKFNYVIQRMENISIKDKARLFFYISDIEWFNWKPDEEYREFLDQIWFRVSPVNELQWISREELDEFYKYAPPEYRARYEVKKYEQEFIEKHKKDKRVLSKEEEEEVYRKSLCEYEKEWKTERAREEENIQKHLKEQGRCIKEQIVTYIDGDELPSFPGDENIVFSTYKGVDGYLPYEFHKTYEKCKQYTYTLSRIFLDDTIKKNKEIPKLLRLNIKSQYMNNTKIARLIGTKQICITNEDKIRTIKIREKTISLLLKPADNIWYSQTITNYDIAVMDAVYTLFYNGIHLFTAEWIIRVMSGDYKQKATPQKIRRIRESLEKLQNIRISIDAEAEFKGKKKYEKIKKQVEKIKEEAPILPVEKVIARYKANGKETVAYKIGNEAPTLYEYAQIKREMVNTKVNTEKKTDGRKKQNDSEETILIKNYVLKRVRQIKNKKNRLVSNRISFIWDGGKKGLFAELGYKPDDSGKWRSKKSDINKKVKHVLDELITDGEIINYKEYREGDSTSKAFPIQGYEIFYELDDPEKKTTTQDKENSDT